MSAFKPLWLALAALITATFGLIACSAAPAAAPTPQVIEVERIVEVPGEKVVEVVEVVKEVPVEVESVWNE